MPPRDRVTAARTNVTNLLYYLNGSVAQRHPELLDHEQREPDRGLLG